MRPAQTHVYSTEVKPTGMNTVFDENTKVKRKERKEAAKGVAHSKIYRAWVNLGSTNLANRGPTSAGTNPYPVQQHHHPCDG
jgi:hypothetical protein